MSWEDVFILCAIGTPIQDKMRSMLLILILHNLSYADNLASKLSELWDMLLAGADQPQADQPNSLKIQQCNLTFCFSGAALAG
eukprot:1161907-Pelagomonas_calceolata.AAC.15